MAPAPSHLLRDLTPQVLGAVVRRFGDFAAAEDAVQEALAAAAEQWPERGIPHNPKAWLIHVAGRRLTDHMRADIARRRREDTIAAERELVAPALDEEDLTERDDALLLLFMCAHPALTRPSAIALTLRAVGGLTTEEIARAFMVPAATMAQRISRAKSTIKESGVRLGRPSPKEVGERLHAVLHVLYLIFNEGYTSSAGASLQRLDLAEEAIRLTRALHSGIPEHAEAMGLLALMVLTHARRDARTGPRGELIALTEQDRGLWNRGAITEGTALITTAMSRGAVGPYQLQAAIAALHDEAPRAEDTDWEQILALYTVLERMSDNPMVTLNRAIALAMVRGPAAGLALLDTLDDDPRLTGHHRLAAVRAHLLELEGDRAGAVLHYRKAASATASVPERDYLLSKAAALA